MAQSDTLGRYLREIGRYPLLTAEEEIELAWQVQDWLTHPDPVPPEVARRGKAAKDKLIRCNLRLVVAIAKKYQRRGLPMLDLIQEGTIGLVRGIEKFDPSRGYKASTYIYWWITQSMTRAIANQPRIIRLPIHIVEKLNKIKKAQQSLSQNLGHQPRKSEIADYLGWKDSELDRILSAQKVGKVASLNKVLGAERDTELVEVLPSSDNPLESLESRLQAEQLDNLLSQLNPQQESVIWLRWGIGDGQARSLAQTGLELGLSRERVRQVERAALAKLKQAALGVGAA